MLNNSQVVTAFKNVAVQELSQGATTKMAFLPLIYGGVLIGIELVLIYEIYKSTKQIIIELKKKDRKW